MASSSSSAPEIQHPSMAGSSSEPPESKILTLKSSNNDEFQVEASIAVQSGTIKNMVEDGYTYIPLVNINSEVLTKIFDYLMKHAEKTGCSEEELKEFDNEFVKMSFKKMSLFVFAANFLNIKGLMNLLCQTIADRIKNKSVNAVRRIFDITSDYTPEEEAEVRAEHEWAYEGELDETVDDDDDDDTSEEEEESEVRDDDDSSEEETEGFKKIGLQKWEYGHYWFQVGKKHLLCNIKRRTKNLNAHRDFNQETYFYGVEEEMRSQRDLNVTLKSEFEKLKERQDDMVKGIASLKEYLEKSEAESRKFLCFLAKAVKQVVATKRGTKCDVEVRDVITSKRRAEDAMGSSKSSEKKKMIDFSAIKRVHDIVEKPKIEGGSV